MTPPWPLAHRLLCTAFVVLVLVQAALAGQSLFGSGDIEVHGYVGNASFLVALLVPIAAWKGAVGRTLLWSGVVVLALTFSQVGLGYSGRNSLDAAAWHVPLGVVVFGLGTAQLTLALVPRRPVDA